jgi:hypothetical protein
MPVIGERGVVRFMKNPFTCEDSYSDRLVKEGPQIL